MNNNKVHSQRTGPTFSWENKPGVSKEKTLIKDFPTDDIALHFKVKLPPPPCPTEKYRASFHDFQIPPPPCTFQPSYLRSSSRKSLRKNDDPFLIAYKECTKSSKKDKHWSGFVSNGDHGGFGLKKNMSIFSCKHSCSVVDDSIVKTSQLPSSRSTRERHED